MREMTVDSTNVSSPQYKCWPAVRSCWEKWHEADQSHAAFLTLTDWLRHKGFSRDGDTAGVGGEAELGRNGKLKLRGNIKNFDWGDC